MTKPVRITLTFMLLLLVAGFGSGRVWNEVNAQQSQETPTATSTVGRLCGAATASGGQTIGTLDTVLVTLPSPGDYHYLFATDGTLLVCHIQTDSRVGISAATCRETARTVNNPAAHAILDQIVASARCTVATATAVPTTAPSVSTTAAVQSTATPRPSASGIRGPDTGSGGLAQSGADQPYVELILVLSLAVMAGLASKRLFRIRRT
jgi:hypothetical protein